MQIAVSKRTSFAVAALSAAGVAAYLLVPGVRESIADAIRVVSQGDVEQAVHGFRDYFLSFGLWAPLASAALMVAIQIAFVPVPTFFITFANGLLFGWLLGAGLSWASSMVGAALCFWIARALGRPVVERLVGDTRALEVTDLFFFGYGDRAVLIARLLPFVSFRAVSYAAGLTPTSFARYFVATGLGQLPGTLLYSWLGGQLTQSAKVLFWVVSISLAITVAGSAVAPLVIGRLRRRREAIGAGEAVEAVEAGR